MKKGEFKFIITSFLGWRVLLLGFVFLAASFFPLQKLFLGGGIENYLKNPYFWSWINFDGEHYLSLALQGYLPLTYFYFRVLLHRKFVSGFGGLVFLFCKEGKLDPCRNFGSGPNCNQNYGVSTSSCNCL